MQSESHPSTHNQGPTKSSSGSKEGLSVYGLFQHLARSPQGKVALKQLFLRPILSMDAIRERHDSVAVFTRPENFAAVDRLTKHMTSIRNIKTHLRTLRRGTSIGSGKVGQLATKVWSGLKKFAYHSIQIYNCLGEVSDFETLKLSRTFADRFVLDDIAAVGQHVSETIDLEMSEEQQRTTVRAGIDPELDQRKHNYDGVDSLLDHVAEDIRKTIPVGLPQDLKVVYLPQIGFLVALPKDEEAGTALWEGTDGEHWEKMFAGDDLVYYKNDKMRTLDNHFGDLFTDICDREIEIIHELALEVLKFEESLATASDVCAELDVLLALAEGAKRYNLCRPLMTEENTIAIEGGRHLLQELTVSAFVPNNFCLQGIDSGNGSVSPTRSRSRSARNSGDDDVASTMILTGPNYSGKSVYLKQVAVLVYLAQVGSFVPASKATIGIVDKILIRIATRESVSRSQVGLLISDNNFDRL